MATAKSVRTPQMVFKLIPSHASEPYNSRKKIHYLEISFITTKFEYNLQLIRGPWSSGVSVPTLISQYIYTWVWCSPHPGKTISRLQSMKACGPFLGLVISLFLFWGYNEAGFNVNLGFNVTFFCALSQFSRAYTLKHLVHSPNWLGQSQFTVNCEWYRDPIHLLLYTTFDWPKGLRGHNLFFLPLRSFEFGS
jgi:hypothetical protein